MVAGWPLSRVHPLLRKQWGRIRNACLGRRWSEGRGLSAEQFRTLYQRPVSDADEHERSGLDAGFEVAGIRRERLGKRREWDLRCFSRLRAAAQAHLARGPGR